MDRVDTLSEKIRGWYEQSPTAQRAYARLRADVSAVAERASPTVHEFWGRVAPLIDPPAKDAAPPKADAEHLPGDRAT